MSQKIQIQAPNYTQTPNVLFDEMFKNLKEGELRVILFLIRQTFGWHKAYDRISLSQLAEKTGMERKSVCRSLNSLIEKGLIEKKIFGTLGKERCYYKLVVEEPEEEELDETDGIETEEEMELISNISYQCPKDTTLVSQRHYPQCPKDTHKRKHTKETKKNNNNIRKERKEADASRSCSPPAHVVSSSSSQKKKTQEQGNPKQETHEEALKAAEQYAEQQAKRGNPVNLTAIKRKAIKEGWKPNETKESLEAQKNTVLEQKSKKAETNKKRINQIIKKIEHCFDSDFSMSSANNVVFVKIGRGSDAISCFEEDFMKSLESIILPRLDGDLKKTVKEMFREKS